MISTLFEPSEYLTSYLEPITKRKFSSYKDFIEACRPELVKLVPQTPQHKYDENLLEIVSTHPRLGVPNETKLSVHSSSEQSKLQNNIEVFRQLNDEYERTFPGLKFVLFVNGRGKDEIIEIFKQRIARGNYLLELKDALNAMCDIAIDRSRKIAANL